MVPNSSLPRLAESSAWQAPQDSLVTTCCERAAGRVGSDAGTKSCTTFTMAPSRPMIASRVLAEAL